MKIRKGFVTNSSSSSFILNFKSNHTIKQELLDDMKDLTYLQLLANIIEDSGTKISKKKAREMISRWLTSDLQFRKFMRSHDLSSFDHTLTDKEVEQVERETEALMAQIEDGSYTVAIEIGDDDEAGSELEHNIVPHLAHTVAMHSNH